MTFEEAMTKAEEHAKEAERALEGAFGKSDSEQRFTFVQQHIELAKLFTDFARSASNRLPPLAHEKRATSIFRQGQWECSDRVCHFVTIDSDAMMSHLQIHQ